MYVCIDPRETDRQTTYDMMCGVYGLRYRYRYRERASRRGDYRVGDDGEGAGRSGKRRRGSGKRDRGERDEEGILCKG